METELKPTLVEVTSAFDGGERKYLASFVSELDAVSFIRNTIDNAKIDWHYMRVVPISDLEKMVDFGSHRLLFYMKLVRE